MDGGTNAANPPGSRLAAGIVGTTLSKPVRLLPNRDRGRCIPEGP